MDLGIAQIAAVEQAPGVEDAEPATTSALVERAQAGDQAAFGQLHDRYGKMVHAIVLRRVSAAEAEDLAQDVFLRAWKGLPGLGDTAAFGPWLGRIARNRATDFLRGRRPVRALPPELGRDAAPVTEARQVLEVIRSLPEAYAETLLMRLVEGMTGPEIAERTGKTPRSVRVNLHRGMTKLRERLGIDNGAES